MQGAETREREAAQLLVPAAALPRPALPVVRLPKVALGVNDAITSRRLFVLLPFAMIAGLVAYAALPFEPEHWALAGVALVLVLGTILLWRSPALSLASLALAGWAGFALLPLHGAWFGTSMLVRPAYGQFEGRVDEIISATDEAPAHCGVGPRAHSR